MIQSVRGTVLLTILWQYQNIKKGQNRGFPVLAFFMKHSVF